METDVERWITYKEIWYQDPQQPYGLMNNDWKPIGINEGQGSNTVSSYSTWDYMRIEQPKRICRCDLFGQGQMVISFYDAQS
jgi:hypothetical protein